MAISEYVYFSILLIVVVVGLVKFKNLSRPGKALFVLVSYVFIKEISAFIIGRKLGYNLSFYKYLSLIDFILTINILLRIKVLEQSKRPLLVISATIVIFYVVNLIVLQPPGKGIDSNFKLVRSFFLVLISLLFFYRMTGCVYKISIWSNSDFWFCTAILIFYVISIFYWGVFNYYLGNKQAVIKEVVRPVFEYANYVFYSMLGAALFYDNFMIGYLKSGHVERR